LANYFANVRRNNNWVLGGVVKKSFLFRYLAINKLSGFEEKFVTNKAQRALSKGKIKMAIDLALKGTLLSCCHN
jgi:hypothetical protein